MHVISILFNQMYRLWWMFIYNILLRLESNDPLKFTLTLQVLRELYCKPFNRINRQQLAQNYLATAHITYRRAMPQTMQLGLNVVSRRPQDQDTEADSASHNIRTRSASNELKLEQSHKLNTIQICLSPQETPIIRESMDQRIRVHRFLNSPIKGRIKVGKMKDKVWGILVERT